MSGNPKTTVIGFDARARIAAGAEKLARAVATTHGPLGGTALIDRFSGLLATKDGLTVAREIFLSDPVENLGARILLDACVKVNDEAGDGTTAAAVLAAALVRDGLRRVAGGTPASVVARQMDDEVAAAAAFVRGLAVPVSGRSGIERVALVAGNGDEEIARLMADACMAVGKDGTVAVEDSKGVDSVLELKEGFALDRGGLDFVEEGTERTIEGALVAVALRPLSSVDDVRDLLETASQWPQNELVLFAPSVVGDAARAVKLNDAKKVVRCAVVQTGGHRAQETLEDVAALAGATPADEAAGRNLRAWDAEWFGAFRKVLVRRRSCLLEAYADKASFAAARVASLKAELTTAASDFDADRLRERIAKLTGGFAVLKVGGVTEAAMKERRARVEDVLGAVRAALRGGVVPGGGVAAFLAARASGREDGPFGAPLRSLAARAGMPWPAVAPRPGAGAWKGWDFAIGRFRDLSDDPLVADAALAVEAGIVAAGSVARTIVMSDAAIVPAWPARPVGRPGRR